MEEEANRILREQIEKSGIKELLKGWDDFLMYGQEIFHVDGEGNTRQIPVMSKEGQDVLDRFYEEDI